MKARRISAVLGIAAAAGAVVFMQSLVATNDRQAVAMAERMIAAIPVESGAKCARFEVDFRPGGRVMQGPPLVAFAATKEGLDGALVAKSLFAGRRIKELPEPGEELSLIGRKGAYRVKIAGYIDWERPARGYPNMLLPPSAAAEIAEEWRPFAGISAEEAAPMFKSDAGRNVDRAKGLLLWAAALTALCLLVNSLVLYVESRRREIATLRMIGLTRAGAAWLVAKEACLMVFAGLVLGVAGALAALEIYVACDPETFPLGAAAGMPGIAGCVAAAPLVAVAGALAALKPALSVRPLEAASARPPRRRSWGMTLAFAFGFGSFVAVEVWGASLMKPFVPSPEWPDAIVSILPAGVSSFDIEKLRGVKGVRRIGELQPLQACILPREGRRNALLLASESLPDFKFAAGDAKSAAKALREGNSCVITEMMARARRLSLGDTLTLDAGRGFEMPLEIAGIVDLNWHMVTSRGLLRGMNGMPVDTDGPVFVSFDTLAACDARPQEFVKMTHVWLDCEPEFLAKHGVFGAGRIIERGIVEALDGAYCEDGDGIVRGNTVRLHARDEIADGTLAHGNELVGAMARIPFVFLAVVSLGFIAMLVASFESRRREFAVMRAVGATRMQLARALAFEALRVAFAGIAFGAAGGAAAGWLATGATRAAMAKWGLPATFSAPLETIAWGAAGAVAFALLVAVPASVVLVRRRESA